MAAKKTMINIDPDETLIKAIHTEDTGGNTYNDVVTLKDGTIIRISEGIVAVFKNKRADENNNETGFVIY
jgi:hypothetical protein